MGKKVFVSYKYWDTNVLSLDNNIYTKVRDYVDVIEGLLDKGDNIYKGEDNNEDLSELTEETISRKLANRIYDSSITIVLISKGMRDNSKLDKYQWIPWEISYSLKEINRGGRASLTNAILAVILPDLNGSYEYFVTKNVNCNCITYNRNIVFKILSENIFNEKNPITRECEGITIHEGYSSYIHIVKWDYFKSNLNQCFNIVEQIKEQINNYNISKSIE